MSGDNRASGQNFWLRSDGTVSFFGNTGRRTGETWFGGMSANSEPVWPMEPARLLPEVLGFIANDVANGFDKELSMLLAGPRQALVLYLEGVITPEDLMRADEPAEGTIRIPRIKFGERVLDVYVRPEANLATADANGTIIP